MEVKLYVYTFELISCPREGEREREEMLLRRDFFHAARICCYFRVEDGYRAANCIDMCTSADTEDASPVNCIIVNYIKRDLNRLYIIYIAGKKVKRKPISM